MKKLLAGLIASIVALVVAGLPVMAHAAQPSANLRPQRPERVRAARTLKTQAPSPMARIKGGTNGDKQLYGSLEEDANGFYGYIFDWAGIMEVKLDGFHVKVSDNLPGMQTGCYFDGKFLGMSWSSSTIGYYIYDAETWEVELQGSYVASNPYVFATDLTYDPDSRRIYGFFLENAASYDCSVGKFGFIDPNNFNPMAPVTVIADMDGLRGISADGNGKLYGVGLDNVLYEINKTTGAMTEVVPLTWMERPSGASAEYYDDAFILGHESAEIDWETGEMYFSGVDDLWDTYIAKIDLTTGEATCVADFGWDTDLGGSGGCEAFGAIFFKQSVQASADAPEGISDLTVTAVGTELKADVTFTMPTKSTAGTALTGDLQWTITDGTNTLSQGTAAPGASVGTTVSVAAEGIVNISAYATYNGQKGSETFARAFVGCDTPVLTDLPDVYPDGNEATIVWTAARAANGGNLAPLTYQVVRMPEGKVVAEATPDLMVTDVLDNDYKTRCTYTIIPVSGTKAGEPVNSRPTYVGTIFPIPHTDAFDDEALFNEYPAIDANNDANTWWVDTNRKAAVYSASSTLAGDDYLCIGPFELMAGCSYTFAMTADGHNRVERVAAYVGTDPTDAKSFSTRIIDETLVNPSVGVANLSGEFVPATSGRYYFGIHACSNANATNLYIYNVNVTGVTGEMPAAPQLTFIPNSATSAELSVVLPTKNLSGDAANVTSLRIYRDYEPVQEITDGVKDGATITYVDNTAGVSSGSHVYTAAAVNANGEGQTATVEAWLGLDQPGEPSNLRVWEDIDKAGLIHLTWQPPKKGANGGYVDPSGVTYTVDWLSYGPTGTGEKNVGSALSFDLQMTADALAEQDIIAFTVKGTNSNGSAGSRSSDTRSTYTGPALPLPLRESWTGCRHDSGIWSGESIVEGEEIFESFWDYTEGNSQDEDGYLMMMSTTKAGGGYRMRTPRVTLADTKAPVFVFHHYFTQFTQDMTIDIAVDDQPFTALKEIEVTADKVGQWVRVEIPLDAYKDSKYVQFGFSAHSNAPGNAVVCVDNVNILDRVDCDLMVTSFTGPKKVSANDRADFLATIRNTGFKDLDGSEYTVKFFKNGEEIDEVEGWPVDAFANVGIEFSDILSVTDPATCDYKVEVAFADDVDKTNNVSATVSVISEITNYPVPTNLTAAHHKQGVALSWNAPEQSAIPGQAVTETFDSYEPFIYENIGQWTTYDVDGAPTVILATSLGVLDYPNVGLPMAWQVIDPAAANIIAGAWYCRSGSNMIVSFQACRDGGRDVTSNDWLVSPELDGSAQTISFYARTGMGNAYSPELMDIYVSDSGVEMADFKVLKADVEVPYLSDWEEYRFALPAGTKHFAIVHKSFDKLALLIDDITYIPGGSAALDINIEGYHVYRNGKRITPKPVAETSFIDSDVKEGDSHSYNVTTIWDKGESGLSNTAVITDYSELTGVTTSSATVMISTGIGVVRVEGAEGLTVGVYTASGACVAQVEGSDVTTVKVPTPGIYIVHAGTATAKVSVK